MLQAEIGLNGPWSPRRRITAASTKGVMSAACRSTSRYGGENIDIGTVDQRRFELRPLTIDKNVDMTPNRRGRIGKPIPHSWPPLVQYVQHITYGVRLNPHIGRGAGEQP